MQEQTPIDRSGAQVWKASLGVIKLVWIQFFLLTLAIGPLRKVRTPEYRGELGYLWTAVFSAAYCVRACLQCVLAVVLFLICPLWIPFYVAWMIRRKKARLDQINTEAAANG
jgi:hypothetical protein